MRYEVTYSEKAVKELRKLEIADAQKIVKKIKWYASKDRPLDYAKRLKEPFNDLYRFRIGEYRTIFEVTERGEIILLTVLRVKHRKDVYE